MSNSSLTVAVVLAAVGGGGLIGGISRFAGSAALGCTAAWVYRAWKDRPGAAGVAIGAGILAYVAIEVLMTLALGPLFFGSLRAAVAVIVPIIIPFNLLKGALNGAVALSLFTLLRRFEWVANRDEGA